MTKRSDFETVERMNVHYYGKEYIENEVTPIHMHNNGLIDGWAIRSINDMDDKAFGPDLELSLRGDSLRCFGIHSSRHQYRR